MQFLNGSGFPRLGWNSRRLSEVSVQLALGHRLISAFALLFATGFRGYPDRLNYDHGQCQAEHTEELEIHPGSFIEIVDDIDIGRTEECEVTDPHQIELTPHVLGQLNGMSHHSLG